MVNILFHIVHILFIYTVNRGKGSWGGGWDREIKMYITSIMYRMYFLQYTKGVYGGYRVGPQKYLWGGGDSEVKMYITSIIYLLYFLQYAQGIG